MHRYFLLFFLGLISYGVSALHTGVASGLINRADTLPLLPKSGGVNAKRPGENRPNALADTILPPRRDSGVRSQVIDTLRISRDSLNAPVEYSAEDSGVILIPSKQMYLYGKASASQTDVKVTANTIAYDQASQTVKAFGNTDTSTRSLTNKPTIVQGGSTSINDTIYFNLNSQKGLLKNSYYQEGEMFVNAQRIKRADAQTAFAFRTLFTTCNLDTPHFAIKSRKVKLITGKLAVTGPAFPEFEGVPMPVAIPFGLFPLNRGRSSGILPPQFAANNQLGLGLEGLGYYRVINDYADATIRGNIYSYGGYNFNISPRYFRRYRYTGNIDFGYQNNKILNESYVPVIAGRPVEGANEEFIRNTGFQIRWSHSMDSKARPGVTFNANVNAGSTRFNQFVANNATRNAQNSLTSGINYGRTWADGKYNLQVNGSHNQNSVTRLINVSLPNVTFSATTIYPFAKKESVGTQKWYEKLGVSYNGTLVNSTAFYDTNISFRKILDTSQWGIGHQIPITLALPALGPVIISPGISFSERWYGSYMIQTWNGDSNRIDTRFRKGFFTAREITTSLNASSRIFGTFNFRGGRVKAIRHEIKPSIGVSYRPDLNKHWYYDIQIDSTGRRLTINPFQNAVGGAYGIGEFGGVTFSLQNLLEMKVRDKSDTSGKADKKVRLIDGFDISTGYNLIIDSFRLQPISINFRSTLFEKVNINGTATLDPYQYNTFGYRVDRFTTPRIAQANIALSTSLTGGKNDEAKGNGDKPLPADPSLTVDEQQRQLEYVRANPAEFVDFDIPWSVSLSMAANLTRVPILGTYRFENQFNASANVSGDFSLTPKWKIGGNTFFDFKTGQINNLSMFLTREMHCWQLAVNVNLGQFQSFNITVNPKSGILRDLRINRSRSFYEY